jgi:hypothetical protein
VAGLSRPGTSVVDSEVLLDALSAHARQTPFIMHHRRRQATRRWGTIYAVLHLRDAFYPKTRRVMYRTQIKGSERIV